MNEHAAEALIAQNATGAHTDGEFLRGIGALALLVAGLLGYSWAIAFIWDALFPGYPLNLIQALGLVVVVMLINVPVILLSRARR